MESEGLCSHAVMGSTRSGSSVETRCAAVRGQINEARESTCDPGRADSMWREDMGECAIPTTYVPDWNANARLVVREQPANGVYMEGEHTWAVCRSDVLASREQFKQLSEPPRLGYHAAIRKQGNRTWCRQACVKKIFRIPSPKTKM